MEQTAVEFLVDKMLYIENEYDMKLINKSEYQAKRRDIIDQAKEIEKQQQNKFNQQLEMLNKSWKEYCKANFKSE